MRIISGSAGRRSIKVPKGVTRPTTDRTREAIFSILGDLVKGARCVDLFAGSGALGMEALSRGAESCLFIDKDRNSEKVITENLRLLKLEGGQVRRGEVAQLIFQFNEEFDIVFADPPYVKRVGDEDHILKLLESDLHESCSAECILVTEAPAGRVAPINENWEIKSQRSYGSCGITIYKKA